MGDSPLQDAIHFFPATLFNRSVYQYLIDMLKILTKFINFSQNLRLYSIWSETKLHIFFPYLSLNISIFHKNIDGIKKISNTTHNLTPHSQISNAR